MRQMASLMCSSTVLLGMAIVLLLPALSSSLSSSNSALGQPWLKNGHWFVLGCCGTSISRSHTVSALRQKNKKENTKMYLCFTVISHVKGEIQCESIRSPVAWGHWMLLLVLAAILQIHSTLHKIISFSLQSALKNVKIDWFTPDFSFNLLRLMPELHPRWPHRFLSVRLRARFLSLI